MDNLETSPETPVSAAPWQVVTFYAFKPIADNAALRETLRAQPQIADLRGTILLAAEGVNGTISHPDLASLQAFMALLQNLAGIHGRDIKWSEAPAQPFRRLKIRLKKETITLRQSSADPNIRTGVHVKAEDWNALIAREDVLLLDTRNAYETEYGQFKGAVDPNIQYFRDFPDFVKTLPAEAKNRPVAMYCTGGIRCEKASAYMLAEGFSEVYQLEGGILRYLENMPEENSSWEGGCFVFDERVAVGHGLKTVKRK